jgi:hypothetical protein
MTWDWEVKVMTDSNYIKTVRVNDCYTRTDAEEAALGMTGAKRVIASNPKSYEDDEESYEDDSSDNSGAGVLVLAFLFLIYCFWKIILIVGIASFIIWIFIKYLIEDTK